MPTPVPLPSLLRRQAERRAGKRRAAAWSSLLHPNGPSEPGARSLGRDGPE